MDEPAVRVLTDEDLMAVGVTPGIVRRVAFESDTYWFGHGLVEAGRQSKSGISIPHPARTPKRGEAHAEDVDRDDRDGSEAAQTPPDRGSLGQPRQVHRTPRFAGAP